MGINRGTTGGVSTWGGVLEEVADGYRDGDVRKKLAGMPENAPGWAICGVGFTGDVFGVDVELSGE